MAKTSFIALTISFALVSICFALVSPLTPATVLNKCGFNRRIEEITYNKWT